jgi:hypothetical protein
MKVVKWVLIVLVGVFVVIQAVRPERSNPPVDEAQTIQRQMSVPPEVSAILERSCNDCHSYNTVWPWYSNIAPASWFVAHDVEEGREHLSLSNWGSYDQKRRARKLEEICEEVKEGEMPVSSYVMMHPEAELSEQDKATLCNWATQESERLGGTPGRAEPGEHTEKGE